LDDVLSIALAHCGIAGWSATALSGLLLYFCAQNAVIAHHEKQLHRSIDSSRPCEWTDALRAGKSGSCARAIP